MHLSRLTYVRTIEDHKHAIRAVIASATSGDIITSSHSDHGSTLMLHTVNAQLVARVNCIERILSLAISTRPEGTSVNVIAGGLNTGSIRCVFSLLKNVCYIFLKLLYNIFSCESLNYSLKLLRDVFSCKSQEQII